MKNKKTILFLSLISLFLIAFFISHGINSSNYAYLLSRRLPKLLAILITGLATAISTTIFQTMTNNIILTPSILGLDSLYLFIQTIIVFQLGSTSLFVINKNINFLISVILMLIFSSILYLTILKKNKDNIMKLLLVGMVLGSLFSSISSFIQMVIDPNEFLIIQDKMFASFNNINTSLLLFSGIIVILSAVYVFLNSNSLDVMALGKDTAINLGINFNKLTKHLLFLVSLLVSVSTALVGPITFLGLLIVNLARHITKGYKHSSLLIISSLISFIALVGGQVIVERIFNFGVPISIIINFIGGIYFIYLLLKESFND